MLSASVPLPRFAYEVIVPRAVAWHPGFETPKTAKPLNSHSRTVSGQAAIDQRAATASDGHSKPPPFGGATVTSLPSVPLRP